jgi:hypothetical protein
MARRKDPSPTAVVFARDEAAVPLQKRLGADDGGEAPHLITPKLLRFGSQSAALAVIESRPSPQLLIQDPDLFMEVLNGELLVAVEPAGQANEQQL